ncbi:MAG: aldo/keto reductase [Micavibrio sp.]|nr:aldo/keto reductase [Micavibrio sp.]
MKTKKLGKTGLDISPLCLGCMTYGVPEAGKHAWTLDEERSRPLVRAAVEAGINFFDTANTYSAGTSEEMMGRLLREFTRREEIVLATKVYFPVDSAAPNRSGLSRKAIMQEIDASLKRLNMDYVDLYQIHRWDYGTPIEETMEALHDVVKAGKARYIGASSMYAWQFAKAQHVAERNGWTRFSTMQNHLNLLYREEEREMLPLCIDQGVGVIPWSPLARGTLARAPDETTNRTEKDAVMAELYAATAEADRKVIDAVGDVAKQRGVARAQVALAWLMQKEGVSAPIIGVSKLPQLEDAVAALELTLTADEIERLERAYIPHEVAGAL